MHLKNLILKMINDTDDKDFGVSYSGNLMIKGFDTGISVSNLLGITKENTTQDVTPDVCDVLCSTESGDRVNVQVGYIEENMTPIGVCVVPPKYSMDGKAIYIGLIESRLRFESGNKNDTSAFTSKPIIGSDGDIVRIPCALPNDRMDKCNFGTPCISNIYTENQNLSTYDFEKNLIFHTDGKDRTRKLVDTSFSFEAANWCNDIVTPGTKRGDWYLPSVSELYHMMVNVRKLNHVIEKVGGIRICDSNSYWSSNVHSRNMVYKLHTYTSNIGVLNKNNHALVRPFFKES